MAPASVYEASVDPSLLWPDIVDMFNSSDARGAKITDKASGVRSRSLVGARNSQIVLLAATQVKLLATKNGGAGMNFGC